MRRWTGCECSAQQCTELACLPPTTYIPTPPVRYAPATSAQLHLSSDSTVPVPSLPQQESVPLQPHRHDQLGQGGAARQALQPPTVCGLLEAAADAGAK